MNAMISSSTPSEAYLREALAVSEKLLKSLRMANQLKDVVTEDSLPLADIEPLPLYAKDDPRSDYILLMERLHLYLRVVDGLRGALIAASSDGAAAPGIIVRWFSARRQSLVQIMTRHFLPRAFISAWKENSEVLADLSRFLGHSIYDSEPQIALEAAQYAVERHLGAILFLAICPNIPFIIPTLEVRLLFTKPLLAITKGIHATFGRFPLIGFFFYLMYRFARFFDGIPRLQVRVAQEVIVSGWLANRQKRSRFVLRYIEAAYQRMERPRVDAIARALLSLVS
jgi:hypothetical protein